MGYLLGDTTSIAISLWDLAADAMTGAPQSAPEQQEKTCNLLRPPWANLGWQRGAEVDLLQHFGERLRALPQGRTARQNRSKLVGASV